MPAITPDKVKTLAAAVSAIKLKKTNVALNLDTGAFEVKNGKNNVIESFMPAKGRDAVYVVNNTENDDEYKKSSDYLLDQRDSVKSKAGQYETDFASKEDSLLKAIGLWKESEPGASRREMSITIGRLQNDLNVLQGKLRRSQYNYREAVSTEGIKRRIFVPASFDDRSMPHAVYKLNATQTSVGLRIVAA